MTGVVIRWVLAVAFMATSLKLISSGMESGGVVAAIPLLGGLALFIATVLLIAPETAVRLAEWFSRPFAAIFFPDDPNTKPPLNYGLARRYRDERRWKDAARQYRKIIRHYPDEIDAYLELIKIAQETGDEEMRLKYTSLFEKRFDEDVKAFEHHTRF